MAAELQNKILTDEFLIDLYFTCLNNEYILSVTCEYVRTEHLPDRDFQNLHKTLAKLFKSSPKCPPFSIVQQTLSRHKSTLQLLSDIYDTGNQLATDECLKQLEAYVKQVEFQKTYRKAGELYNKQLLEEAYDLMQSYATWFDSFNLCNQDFINVIDGFDNRLRANKSKRTDEGVFKAVNSFYIDELDKRNGGRDLRGQLTCFLASTGVGKSHIARWIGKNACQFGGLNVLHIQLEGSQDEVVDAYSASLAGCSAYAFSGGNLSEEELEQVHQELDAIAGELYVKSYPYFGVRVTTSDVYKAIQDYKKVVGVAPDVVIIDSMDLLYPPQSYKISNKDGQRLARIEIARILKDMAASEKVWIVVTYQSTIEDREKLNDEKFVLTEYNTSEAKGLSRPLTHLITLNQSTNESKENIMRLNIAKSRFFKKGEPFKIATDYEHENFYDRVRSMNINKVTA